MLEEQGGVHELNMRELARRCEVSHAAPYRHFQDANELVRAVAHRGFELLDVEFAQVVEEIRTAAPIDRYVALGVHFVDWALENRGYVYAIAEIGPLPDPETAGERWLGGLRRQVELVREMQEEGYWTESDAELVALGGWFYVQGITRILLSGELDRLGDGVSIAKALIKQAANVPVARAESVRMFHRPRHEGSSDAALALLDATAELIAHEGLAGFSLREASRRSGVSPSAPAKLFGDREGTLRALALDGYAELDDHVARAVRRETEPSDAVRTITEAYSRFAEEHPGHAGVMWRSDLFPPGERPPGWGEASVLVRLRDACEKWLDDHDLDEPDADLLAFAALALAHGTASLWLEGLTPARYDSRDLASLANLTREALAVEMQLAREDAAR